MCRCKNLKDLRTEKSSQECVWVERHPPTEVLGMEDVSVHIHEGHHPRQCQ